MRGRAAAVVLAAVVGAVAVVHYARRGSEAAHPVRASIESASAGLPAPAEPAFRVGRPRLLNPRETREWYAPVLREVAARSAPRASAPRVAPLGPRTPEGTTNIVLIVGERVRRAGLWVRVRLAILPNGRTGWVPRTALGALRVVHTHLVVDRAAFTATLYDDGRKVFAARVGVGTPASPTPGGQFYVRERLSGFGDPFYGPVAFGTSARSPVLTDWPGGGFVGIHGTNEPQRIPGRISHGCIRLRNADILRLGRLMPVGTPVTIR